MRASYDQGTTQGSSQGSSQGIQGGAKPIAKRRPGETARGPDGKRRKKDGVAAGDESEIIELSD